MDQSIKSMKVNGEMVCDMVREHKFMQTAAYTLETGKMVLDTAGENTKIQMNQSTKETSTTMSNMVMGN